MINVMNMMNSDTQTSHSLQTEKDFQNVHEHSHQFIPLTTR